MFRINKLLANYRLMLMLLFLALLRILHFEVLQAWHIIYFINTSYIILMLAVSHVDASDSVCLIRKVA